MNKVWSQQQDTLLLQIIKYKMKKQKFIYFLFIYSLKKKRSSFSTSSNNRYKWYDLAIELNKELNEIESFKTSKECKERWHNHLNPELKKYFFIILCIDIYFFQNKGNLGP